MLHKPPLCQDRCAIVADLVNFCFSTRTRHCCERATLRGVKRIMHLLECYLLHNFYRFDARVMFKNIIDGLALMGLSGARFGRSINGIGRHLTKYEYKLVFWVNYSMRKRKFFLMFRFSMLVF